MIHYSCDLCGARLDSENQRYVVKIEVYASSDEARAQADDFSDMDEQLGGNGESEDDSQPAPACQHDYHGFRFDLCPHCRRRYLSDPLFRAAKKRMGFSEN